ncbi:biogenesis of lysosome-related organelles complex-1 subunit 2-domain-containing protein [Umbelopsis sp. PMI_123]|nr:biogenesis of lysosome-related organelles complex-1 subunit 2-domain-containing protein [Umbelopsis sp. PMI_123]
MDQPKPSASQSAPLPRASTKSQFDPDKASASLGQEHVQRLSENLFKKLTQYTQGELIASSENYKLLEAMNHTTRERYADMSEMAQRLVKEMSRLQSTYADFSEYMKQIDDISEQADYMEKVCLELDDYTKYLEDKLRNANRAKT